MALRRTWHSVVDIPLLETTDISRIRAEALLALKRCLIGDFSHGGVVGPTGVPPAPWVLEYSSDSTAFGASDLWVDVDDVVYANSGSASRSWVAARSPSAGKRAVIDSGSTQSSNNNGYSRIYATKDPWSNVGSLATNQAPNAATYASGGADVPNGSGELRWQSSALGNHRAAFTMCSDGEHWMFFVYRAANHPSSSVVVFAAGIWPIDLREGVVAEHPWVIINPRGDAAGTDRVSGIITAQSGSYMCGAYIPGYNTASKVLVAANASGTNSMFQNLDGASPFTGRYDEIQAPLVPIDTGFRNVIGRLEDFGFVHLNAQGSVEPVAGPVERAAFGNWLVPFAVGPAL